MLAEPADACGSLRNGGSVKGAVAMVERGSCPFVAKVCTVPVPSYSSYFAWKCMMPLTSPTAQSRGRPRMEMYGCLQRVLRHEARAVRV